MKLLKALSVFDWITPTLSLLSDNATLSVPEEETARATEALRKAGIKVKLPNYTDGYLVFDVDQDEADRARAALERAGLRR